MPVPLGTKVYTDEYGSPYIRRRTWDWADPDHLYYLGYQAGAPQMGYMVYVPKWEPDPTYDSWPVELRACIPRDWSGDFTKGGWTSALRGQRTGNPAFPGWEEYQDPRLVGGGVAAIQCGALYTSLRFCGWGKWVGMPSSTTGVRGKCEMRTGLDFGAAFEAGADMFKAVGKQFGAALKAIAKLVSFIPGVGTIVAAVFAGIGALAAGENISEALLDAAVNAVPGGGLAKDAMKIGINTAKTLIAGGNIGEAALAAARGVLEAQGVPANVLVAFDVGVAAGTGKGLQEAGFKALALFAPGNDLIERGLNYTKAIQRATTVGRPVEAILEETLGTEVQRVANASALLGPALKRIDEDQSLLGIGSGELAERLGIDEPVARAAQAVMRTGEADEALLRRLFMTPTERAFEKYDARAVASEDFAPKWATEYLNRQIARSALEDDGLKWKAQYEQQQAALARSAVIDRSLTFKAQYLEIYGVDLSPPKASPPPVLPPLVKPAITASISPPSRSSLGQDVALGATVAAALGALYWWASAEA